MNCGLLGAVINRRSKAAVIPVSPSRDQLRAPSVLM
jgi:hypothetical protein